MRAPSPRASPSPGGVAAPSATCHLLYVAQDCFCPRARVGKKTGDHIDFTRVCIPTVVRFDIWQFVEFFIGRFSEDVCSRWRLLRGCRCHISTSVFIMVARSEVKGFNQSLQADLPHREGLTVQHLTAHDRPLGELAGNAAEIKMDMTALTVTRG